MSPSPKIASATSRRPRFPDFRRTAIAHGVALLAALTAAPGAWSAPPPVLPNLKNVVSGANVLPIVTTANGSTLTIDQTQQNAIIQWNTFNVGAGNTVRFVQPGTTSAALNRTFDSSPSVIMGQIQANGQIYLINQNGIVFGAGSQVNVGGLIASTLNISNTNFLQSLSAETVQGVSPTFTGGYDASGNPTAGPATASIVIGTSGGAAPSLNTAVGGHLFFFAPTVYNQSGVLNAPEGQVVLAGGNAIYLFTPGTNSTVGLNPVANGLIAPPYSALRGYLVETGSDGGPAASSSLVQNKGTINAAGGNVTLAALAVNQDGRVSATSAALFNGSIYLEAGNIATNSGIYESTVGGTLTLGAGSVTETPLKLTDTTTIPASQSVTTGFVYGTGALIDVEGTVSAPSGSINFQAANATNSLSSRLYLGSTAVLNVAGNWADVPASEQLQTFKVTSNELANAPDQKGGILEGATVTVDLNAPSTILDLAGYQQAQPQTLAEKATAGGSVVLGSAGDVITRQGSVINANGGGLNYAAGEANTTLLLGANGNIYNINTAPENLQYLDILNTFQVAHPRWGQTTTYDNTLFNLASPMPAFTQGAAGGSITINPSGSLVIAGSMTAQATVGGYQLNSAPRSGTLTIGIGGVTTSYGVDNLLIEAQSADPLPGSFNANSTLPTPLLSQTVLPVASISDNSGPAGAAQVAFDTVSLTAANSITVAAGANINMPTGGTLIASATAIDVAGHISAPAGTIQLQSLAAPPAPNPNAAPISAVAGLTLESSAQISTAGLWLNNDSLNGTAVGPTLPFAMAGSAGAAATSTEQGGSITLTSPDTVLKSGSVIDVSGGGQISSAGQITGGNGGSIVVNAQSQSVASGLVSSAHLDATFEGYSLATGGSLSLTAANVSIGGSSSAANALQVDPQFFEQGGFSSFSLTGVDGVTLGAHTTIHPESQSFILSPNAAVTLASGGNLAGAASIGFLPAYERPAASLSLSAPGPGAAPLVIGAGSSIVTDAKGRISLAADDGMTIAGSLIAPGGSITLSSLTGRYQTPGFDGAAVTIDLASGSLVSTAGTFVAAAPSAPPVSLTEGTVLAGGTVSIVSNNAQFVAGAGSVIDVSGTSHVIDEPTNLASQPYAPTVVGSNAGLISITSTDGAVFDGSLRGHAGNATSAGGSFALTVTNRNSSTYGASYTLGREIIVTQTTGSAIANPADIDADVAINPLVGGGFDKLHLSSEDTIQFQGRVNVDFARGITIDAPEFRFGNGSSVHLTSTEVALQDSFAQRQADVADNNNGGNPYLNTSPSPIVPTIAGNGQFSVNAQNIDLFGSLTINGVDSTVLSSAHDIRLSGRQVTADGSSLIGSLTTPGNVTLSASQIYPTTRSNFSISVANQPDTTPGDATIVPGGRIVIERNGAADQPVISAGGSMTLSADTIDQGGTLRAPLGQITLTASTALTLESGSLTSVSAAGEIIPYGETNGGVQWQYSVTPSSSGVTTVGAPIDAPPTKAISLSAPEINQKSGATVDVSGGGDILGIEFVPGSGGSTDVLTQANTYAIIPASHFTTAPYDPDIYARADTGLGFSPTQSRDGSVYNSIQIGAGGVVPAGTYVLLPATYALLPGAYMVQLATGSQYQSLTANQVIGQPNGLNILSGRLEVEGTSIAAATTVGVIVQPGQKALNYSDFNLFGASFFAQQAALHDSPTPILPGDGGQLTIVSTASGTGTSSLNLAGNFITGAAAGGVSAAVDISAPDIAIVNSVGQAGVPAGYLQLSAQQLSSIDGNVLVGGVRTSTAAGINVTSTAQNIEVANSATDPLHDPELILTASQSITINAGAVVEGSGRATGEVQNITADSSGALIRLANSGPVTVTRANPSSASGTITVAAGSTLGADGSLLLDATQSTQIAGNLAVARGGALSLDAPSMALGDTTALGSGFAGLTLSNQQLAQFDNLGSLTLSSVGTIGFYGPLTLGNAHLNSLNLDTSGLIGEAGSSAGSTGAVALMAHNFTLQNSGGASYATDANPVDSLSVAADRIVVGGGNQTITGFTSVNLAATGNVNLVGNGQLNVGSNLNVSAQAVIGQTGAAQTWSASTFGTGAAAQSFNVALNAAAGVTSTAGSAAGAAWTVDAASISAAVPVVMHSGSINLNATSASGSGVTLAAGAVLDVSGSAENFNGHIVTADAGTVQIVSATNIALAAGSVIDVSGNANGGNAGALDLTAQSLSLAGTLKGGASAGASGGQVSVDLTAVSDFSSLNGSFAAGGFTGAIGVRARTGDLVVAATDDVVSHNITLTADAGSIDVAGTLDASAPTGGGSINLFAQNNLTLESGSLLSVRGTSTAVAAGTPAATGGSVDLEARSGQLNFASGATIDLSPGATGAAGTATLVAARTTPAAGINMTLAGTINSSNSANPNAVPATVLAEGLYTTTNAAPSVADFQTYAGNTQAFLTNTSSSFMQTRGDAHVVLAGAVEIDSPGDLTINDSQSLDLTSGGWTAGANLGGTLTLRAAGNLIIDTPIGLPTNTPVAAPTWSIRLVGGADLNSANPLAVQSASTLAAANTGNVLLPTATSKVSDGTGNITVVAGNDFVIGNNQAVIYTLGQSVTSDPNARYLGNGGNISITAQNDAIGTSNEWITDWLRRPIAPRNQALGTGGWWVDVGNFQENIGSFGGGSISINAGRDVNDLSAMSASAGTVDANTGNLLVYGGGNLSVSAGRNISGGSYLVSQGFGTIRAGGSVGFGTGTQIFEMGASGDPSTSGANVTVSAGGAITLAGVADPTALLLTKSINDTVNGNNGSGFLAQFSTFYNYAPTSSLNLLALGGDVTLGADPIATPGLNPRDNVSIEAADNVPTVLPPIVNVVSWSGNIAQSGGASTIVTYPSAAGQVSLLAGGSINNVNLLASDLSPSSIPNVMAPGVTSIGASLNSTPLATTTSSLEMIAAQESPKTTDQIVDRTTSSAYVFDIQALNGSIIDSGFTLPGRSRIWAADSIELPGAGGVDWSLENLNPTDVSIVQANTGLVSLGGGFIHIGGPGQLLVQAGKTVDLGTDLADVSLESTGAADNPALTNATSARLTVVAGVTGNVDLANLDSAFTGIRSAGESTVGSPEQHAQAATQALGTFLGNARITGGDIDSFDTSIQTSNGSGIDLIAPRGNITVGLSTSLAGTTASPGSSANTTNGVVTNDGAINSFLSGDFLVDSGKVVTVRGGDITIFTTAGNIDAGRGAQTSFTATSFITTLVNNVPITTISPGVAGSGIRTVTTPDIPGDPPPPPSGSIFLFAPAGYVNAGEAGIASGGNIFIAAQQVLNASNVTAAGSEVGVPQVQSGSLAASLASSGVGNSSADQAASAAAQDAANRAAASLGNALAPPLLSVDVLGFGPNNCKENQPDCFKSR